MMNSMNTPIPTVAAIGNPSSATNLKNCVIMCVFIGSCTLGIKRLTTKNTPAIL